MNSDLCTNVEFLEQIVPPPGPVRWLLRVSGIPLILTTRKMLSPRRVAQLVRAELGIAFKTPSRRAWYAVVRRLLADLHERESSQAGHGGV